MYYDVARGGTTWRCVARHGDGKAAEGSQLAACAPQGTRKRQTPNPEPRCQTPLPSRKPKPRTHPPVVLWSLAHRSAA
jgi:hypothetical protein